MQRRRTLALVAHLSLVLTALTISPAWAEVLRFRADLTVGTTVPPSDGAGTGQGEFTFDSSTNQLTFWITFQGLTGPATGGHIHGPADPGANGRVIVPFVKSQSPISGTVTLDDEEAAALRMGRLYVDIHTNANTGGEIRGQIVK